MWSEARATRLFALLAFPLLTWAAFAGAKQDGSAEILRQAAELSAAKDFEGAAKLLADRLRRGNADGPTCELYGKVLGSLARNDESAHWFEQAAQSYAREGKDGPSKSCIASVRHADVLSSRRDAFLSKVASTLTDASADLLEQGHNQRALDILERLAPIASGKTAERASELLAKARAAFERVDLEGGSEGGERKPAASEVKLVEFESEHYKLSANLDEELAHRVADLMDDLHGFYVQVYFDGDAKKARSAKATIRIHPDRADMLKSWQGGAPPEGWWSPGENTVHCYDTRSGGPGGAGSLDWMLEVLFHEASHQFMSLLSQGGFVPAWINEGTASFFEGTVAMADHRVLWPEAALGRLGTLRVQLTKGSGPNAADVVGYDSPASYPAEYYSFGWGLVYFLQQYEDPKSLEYVYRPLYAQYRSEVIKRGGDSMKLFEEVFLGKHSPLGHQTFADFNRDWSKWITDEVGALNDGGAKTRALRLEHAARCLAAADAAAKEGKKAKVSEKELLNRALSHLEYVRGRLDKDDKPDGALLVEQAEILERLGRPAAAAPLYEKALDLADQSHFELDEKRYAELEKRLKKLDSKNAALRTARARTQELGRSAVTLLAEYEKAEPRLTLRSYTFAALASGVLRDEPRIAERAVVLRDEAREHGLLLGSIHELRGDAARWKTVFSTPPERFAPQSAAPELVSVRTSGFICADVEARGEYEVRARIVRAGKIELGSAWGVVVAGREGADWYMAGIDEKGQAGFWSVRVTARGGTTPRREAILRLSRPVEPDEHPELVAHVYADGKVELRVGDRPPVASHVPLESAIPRCAGLFVKNGAAAFENLLLEIYP